MHHKNSLAQQEIKFFLFFEHSKLTHLKNKNFNLFGNLKCSDSESILQKRKSIAGTAPGR